MIWRCAGDFQDLTEIQNDRHRSIKIFWGRKNSKKLFGQFFLILTSHSSQHVDVQVIF